jgi:hypothetical protein
VNTLLGAAAFAFVAAFVYFMVGRRVMRRRIAGEAQLAVDLFGVWWYSLAGTTLIGALLLVAAAFQRLTLPLHVAATYVNVFVICMALWGLLYYLIYLYTGSRAAIVPLTVFYIVYYFTLVYFVTVHQPIGVNVLPWQVSLAYQHPPEGSLFFVIVLLLLVVPQILGALAYFFVFFRVRDRTQRFRIAVVSWSIILWFASAFLGAYAGLAGTIPYWPIVSRTIGLLAAVAIWIAFSPPAWMRRRFHLTGYGDERHGRMPDSTATVGGHA